MNDFRELFDPEGRRLEDNDRPIQPLNDRVVYYRSDDTLQ